MNESSITMLRRSSDQARSDFGKSEMASGSAPSVASTGGVEAVPERHFPLKLEDTSGNNSDKGNNSDGTNNSAIAGLSTNDYFGFNFEEDQNMLDEGGKQLSAGNIESGKDGVGEGSTKSKTMTVAQQKGIGFEHPGAPAANRSNAVNAGGPSNDVSAEMKHKAASHQDAAAEAVANLQSIATESLQSSFSVGATSEAALQLRQNLKRKAVTVQIQSNGYNPDDESNLPDTASVTSDPSHVPSIKSDTTHESSPSKPNRKRMNDFKREERNAREKERSYRIANQINELRGLLSTGGVIVPKGTKSSVLTEAANYIRMLQQHQYRSELDRHQLIQQIQVIGGGTLGPQAANAIRHVAAQNGIWSLGNFGGLPPRTAMTGPQEQQQQITSNPAGQASNSDEIQQQGDKPLESPMLTKIEEHDYRFIFNSCLVGMAVASMGGSFIDCNQLFTQLSQYTKQEICSMTIFNLTSRADLQHAFDLVSQMISPPMDGSSSSTIPRCVLRGSMKNRVDIGLSITLIKGDDGIAKCFCVTLIQNPSSPFDTSRPIPATADFLTTEDPQQQLQQQQMPQSQMNTNPQIKQDGKMVSPAFMTG